MKSGNRPYIPELDQLRGLAAVLVVYYHSIQRGYYALDGEGWIIGGSPLETLIYEGHTAVSLFLVLSGFVLARGLFGKDVSYPRFLRNRLLRIFPLMTFIVVFAIYGSKEYSLSELLAPFLLLTNTSIAFTDHTELTGTLWTITVIFQFYLIAPLLITFVARGGVLRFLLPIMLLAFAAKAIVLYANRYEPEDLFAISYYSIVGRFNQFMVGIGLAFLWPTVERFAARRASGFAVMAVSLAGILAYCYLLNRTGGIMEWHTWHVIVPEFEALIWAAFIAGFVLARPIANRTLGSLVANLGLVSYSLYVMHWPIHVVAWQVYEESGLALFGTLAGVAWFTTLIVLPASLVMAVLSYWCLEKPFLGLRQRYVESQAPTQRRVAA